MKFGAIGAGTVSLAFAREALATGHEVVLSGRRGPELLACKVAELGRGASAATVGEAASFDYVLLAVPWSNVEDALRGLPVWNGRVLIDATNPFIAFDHALDEFGGLWVIPGDEDDAAATILYGSFIEARGGDRIERLHDPGARRQAGYHFARPLAAQVGQHEFGAVLGFGFVPVYLGGLATGGRLQQAGGPLAGRDLVDFGSL